MIHELDRSFVDQVYAMQRHIRILMELMEQGCIDDTCLEKVRQMQKNVEIIESKYTKNSPGLLLLGPIGTTSIVVKEQQLARRLLQYVNEMNQILNQMAQVYGVQGVIDRGPIASVELGLQHNSALLASIRHAKQKLSAEAKKEIKQFEKAA